MGIDFNSLIAGLAKSTASMQKDTSKIDTKDELATYVSGFDAIKAKATSQNESVNNDSSNQDFTNIGDLEKVMKQELNGIMGADFARNTQNADAQSKFSDSETSLESLMSYLDDDVDVGKIREYNKLPVSNDIKSNAFDTLTSPTKNGFQGFDVELLNIIMENPSTAGALKYMKQAVEDGSADRIAKNSTQFSPEEVGEDLETAQLLNQDAIFNKTNERDLDDEDTPL